MSNLKPLETINLDKEIQKKKDELAFLEQAKTLGYQFLRKGETTQIPSHKSVSRKGYKRPFSNEDFLKIRVIVTEYLKGKVYGEVPEIRKQIRVSGYPSFSNQQTHSLMWAMTHNDNLTEKIGTAQYKLK